MGPRRLADLLLLLSCLGCASSCTGRDISLGEGSAQTQRMAPDLSRWQEPRPLSGLAPLDAPDPDAKDDDPALTGDLRTLFFNSKRVGGQGQEDIWSARRPSTDAPFSPPVPERLLNSAARETGIALSADGLSLWFSSDREGGAGGLDVYLAQRTALGAPWSVARVPELSSADDDLISSVAERGRSLYLARRTSDEDDYDLYLARRADTRSAFAAPLALAAFNSPGEESDAVALEGTRGLVFTRDEELTFAPDYPDPNGLQSALVALNSDDDDRDAWFSADLTYVVFSSDRTGVYQLYEAHLLR